MIKYVNLINTKFKLGPNIIRFKKSPCLAHIGQINNYSIIYSPLLGRLFRLNKEEYHLFKNLPPEGIINKEIKKYIRSGLLIPKYLNLFPNHSAHKINEEIGRITLFLTTNCNTDCKYCYADHSKTLDLSFDIVKRAMEELSKKKLKQLIVAFHGGGEPTLCIDVIKKIAGYLKTKRLKTDFSIQTNGIMSDDARYWLLRNVKSIGLSCDGPPKIQDKQRPLKNGGTSSPFVEKTIKFLVKNNYKNFLVNTVISSFSVDKMDEIVEYFYNLGVKIIKFGTLSVTKRSQKNKIHPPNLTEFSDNALKALKLADRYKMKLGIDLLPINKPKNYFCGTSKPHFSLTPDGYISSCNEAIMGTSEMQKFIYGKFDKTKNKFVYYDKKKNYLKRRTANNIKECQDCYLRWVCAGDCPAKAYRCSRNIFKPCKERCRATRALTKKYLLYKAHSELDVDK